MVESRCGILCSKLGCDKLFNVNCKGCINISKPFWGECPVKKCCEERHLEHCGLCFEFPCSLLKSFAYDKEQGDNGARICQCEKWASEKVLS
jgi:hypothetical protein